MTIIVLFVSTIIVGIVCIMRHFKKQEALRTIEQERIRIEEEKLHSEKIERLNKLKAKIVFEYNEFKAITIDVKGIYYRGWDVKEIIPMLTVEDEIKLKKDPKNEYDPFAVKVMYNKLHLGYIPHENAMFVSELIDYRRIKKVMVNYAGGHGNDAELELTVFYNE